MGNLQFDAETELARLIEDQRKMWKEAAPGPRKERAFDDMAALHFCLQSLRLKKKNVAGGRPS